MTSPMDHFCAACGESLMYCACPRNPLVEAENRGRVKELADRMGGYDALIKVAQELRDS